MRRCSSSSTADWVAAALEDGGIDRVVVMDEGRLIAEGTPATVRRDPAVVAAYLGEPGG